MSSVHVVDAERRQRAAGARVAELFDEHARIVLGLCRYLLRDAAEAEDAAQQTFLSAYRSLLSGVQPRSPRPWLTTIARNECRARLEKRRSSAFPAADPEESAFRVARDASEVAGEREAVDELKAAIAALPQRQRHAVLLRDFHGLSYDEIAEELSLSPSAVEALLFRARARLRDVAALLPRVAQPACVPIALREHLARLVPGFESASSSGAALAGGGGAVAGVLAKLAAGPTAAKVAATVAAVTAGGVATVEVADVLKEERPALAAPAVSSGSARSAPDRAPDSRATRLVVEPAREEDRSGPSGDDRSGSNSSGSGSSGSGGVPDSMRSGSSGYGSSDSDSSSSGSSTSGDGLDSSGTGSGDSALTSGGTSGSGSSGSGSSTGGTSGSGSSGSSGSGSTSSGTSGSGSSGTSGSGSTSSGSIDTSSLGSSGSGSSGSGTSSSDSTETGSTGSGSDTSGTSGSSGAGTSGSGTSGSDFDSSGSGSGSSGSGSDSSGSG